MIISSGGKFKRIGIYNPIQLESVTKEDGYREYTLPNGMVVPSVTTFLSETSDSLILDEWKNRIGEDAARRISSIAASRGKIIHGAIEHYLKNEEIDLSKLMPDSRLMFKRIVPVLDSINNIALQETQLYSYSLKLAGTVDCIGEWKNELAVIDFKTANQTKTYSHITDYFLQCTAYAIMFREMYNVDINKIIVVISVENETPQVFEESIHDKWMPMLFKRISENHERQNIKLH